MQYDRNGVLVKNTQAGPTLRKMKRVILIDSRDRDPTKYTKVNGGATTSDPGDYVVYLPRPFENVISIRLMSAEIAAPQTVGFPAPTPYILLSLEGLNRMDETAPLADRSGLVDTAFAKIPINASGAVAAGAVVYYNDKISPENVTVYSPPVSNLNRVHVTFRHHIPASAWNTYSTIITATNPVGAPITFGTSENSLMLEIEYLDNGFDDFSTFQSFTTRGRGY